MTEDCQAPCVQHVHYRNTASSREEHRAGSCAWREVADDIYKEVPGVKALLHFVNLVSSDIKRVLSKSHESGRAVDHRRYPQRQIACLFKTAPDVGPPISADTKTKDRVDTEEWSPEKQTDQMTNICSSKDRVSPVREKYPFLMPAHPSVTNVFPTSSSSSLATGRHHDVQRTALDSHERGYQQLQCGSKPGVPLRQRHLPASFWKEPNVPKYPFLPHCARMLPLNWQQQGLEYKDFIDRLQAGQIHGLTTIGSRFPITEFLYYNYGMKNRVDGSSTIYNDNLWPLGLPQHKKHLTPSVPGLPTVCSCIGCNCTSSTTEATHKGQEGQRPVPPQLDLLQSSVWKPIPTKTLSSYPARFHPFTHAR